MNGLAGRTGSGRVTSTPPYSSKAALPATGYPASPALVCSPPVLLPQASTTYIYGVQNSRSVRLAERQIEGAFQPVRTYINMANSVEDPNLSELNMQELLAEQKKRKTSLLTHQFIIGLMAGVAVFSVVNKGFTFSLWFPLLFILILVRSGKGLKEKLQSVRAEIEVRNK